MSLEWQSGWNGLLIEDASRVLDTIELGDDVADWLWDENEDAPGWREHSIWIRFPQAVGLLT